MTICHQHRGHKQTAEVLSECRSAPSPQWTPVKKPVGKATAESKRPHLSCNKTSSAATSPQSRLQRFICPIIQRAGTYIHMKASPYLPQLLCAGWMASSAVIRCLLKRQSLMVPKPKCCVAGVWQSGGGWTSLGEMLMCCGGHWAGLSVGAKPC